jgi:hypothetical protein
MSQTGKDKQHIFLSFVEFRFKKTLKSRKESVWENENTHWEGDKKVIRGEYDQSMLCIF